jgi:hypothetical protein
VIWGSTKKTPLDADVGEPADRVEDSGRLVELSAARRGDGQPGEPLDLEAAPSQRENVVSESKVARGLRPYRPRR